jgi:hypothetical protein
MGQSKFQSIKFNTPVNRSNKKKYYQFNNYDRELHKITELSSPTITLKQFEDLKEENLELKEEIEMLKKEIEELTKMVND